MLISILRLMPKWSSIRSAEISTLSFVVCAFMIIGFGLSPTIASAQMYGSGPTSLFITYQCEPENKAKFRSHMVGAGVQQFETWKKQGVYKDYLVLFSSFVNAGETAPDMLVRLDFAAYADTAEWKNIEHTLPASRGIPSFFMNTLTLTALPSAM